MFSEINILKVKSIMFFSNCEDSETLFRQGTIVSILTDMEFVPFRVSKKNDKAVQTQERPKRP